MKQIDHLPPEEQKHFELCTCGEYFDCRDLAQVFDHVHKMGRVKAEWTFSIKVGEPVSYTRKKQKLGLN